MALLVDQLTKTEPGLGFPRLVFGWSGWSEGLSGLEGPSELSLVALGTTIPTDPGWRQVFLLAA